MWSALRQRAIFISSSSTSAITKNLSHYYSSSFLAPRHFSSSYTTTSTNNAAIDGDNKSNNTKEELLSLSEVEKILKDVGADDVQVIPAPNRCEYTDHMVIATGRSPWHVRNISQALIYKVKQKQKGAKRMLLPAVVGQEGGKWIVIDSGTLIIHAVDEKARAYYNFEGLWSTNTSDTEPIQDLEKAFVKVRRKNNSKKPSQVRA